MVFNATFNNISVLSWRQVLSVKETGVPGENHWPVSSVDELSSARIWQHKLCATYSADVNINNRLPIKVCYRICTLRHIRIEIIHGSQNVFWVLTWVSKFYPSPLGRDKILERQVMMVFMIWWFILHHDVCLLC
jgi:hypothetical protein